MSTYISSRCYAATQTAVKTEKTEKVEKAGTGKESQSFTTNIFRGQLQINQVFPFPEPLNAEQTETIRMFLDPVEKFFEVIILLYFLKFLYLT